MEIIAGPFAIVAVVLAVGGIAKIVNPAASAASLRSLRIPSSPLVVRTLAVGEVIIAAVALGFGGRLAALAVAFAFGLFALMMYMLVRSGSTVSCGCFGRVEAPPSTQHVVTNVTCALVAAGAAGLDVVSVGTLLSEQPAAGIPMVLFIASGSAATIAVFTLVGRLRVSADVPAVRTFGMNS
jgi:hypothetical protein